MVLKMADFVKSCKSLQTLCNASKTVLKWFVTACATVCVNFVWIRKGEKLADFEQRAWAIAHGFEHGRFWQVLETPTNSRKRLQTVLKWFVTACATLCVNLGWIRKCRKLADFEQRAWAMAHGFEHGRFWQFLETPTNSRKRLQNRAKMICDYLRDSLCQFRVNSQVLKIARFLTKGYNPWFWTWTISWKPGNPSKHSETPLKPF